MNSDFDIIFVKQLGGMGDQMNLFQDLLFGMYIENTF